MHESPKACFNISKVSLPVLPNLTQNLMHTLCSSTSAIPPISENRRRLMKYTYKDTCNNHTLPHPTTPLGTLTHKTPPQYTLAGNSWTTSDLRVMSIVLGRLDTPSYIWGIWYISGQRVWPVYVCCKVDHYLWNCGMLTCTTMGHMPNTLVVILCST